MAAQKGYKFPAFDDLPKVEGMPQGSIWGFFDEKGNKDEVGSRFTPPKAPQSYSTNTRKPSTSSPLLL